MKIPRIPTFKILETDRQLKELLTEHGITDITEQQEIITKFVNIFAGR